MRLYKVVGYNSEIKKVEFNFATFSEATDFYFKMGGVLTNLELWEVTKVKLPSPKQER